MPNEKRYINFDTLDYTPVTITKRGRTWELRDDVPMRVMAQCFKVLNFWPDFSQRMAGVDESDEAEAKAAIDDAFDELAAMTVPLVGAIFRHTLPETTDAEIAEWFSDEERVHIIRDFFTLRSQSLTPQPSAPPATASPNGPNRQQRRGTR